jgi:hypothetical protein
MQTVKVVFLSDDYFKLAQARADLAAAFALGTRVIAIVDGTAYEVVDEGQSAPAVEIPATLAPIAQERLGRAPPQPVARLVDLVTALAQIEPNRGAEPVAQPGDLGQEMQPIRHRQFGRGRWRRRADIRDQIGDDVDLVADGA